MTSRIVAAGVAALLLVLLGQRAGTVAMVAGIGLIALGWLLHDDCTAPTEEDDRARES